MMPRQLSIRRRLRTVDIMIWIRNKMRLFCLVIVIVADKGLLLWTQLTSRQLAKLRRGFIRIPVAPPKEYSHA